MRTALEGTTIDERASLVPLEPYFSTLDALRREVDLLFQDFEASASVGRARIPRSGLLTTPHRIETHLTGDTSGH